MRLRQAHAILETATALEASGLGIEMHPFDHDGPGNTNRYGDDYMTGSCEFANEQGRQARIYNIDVYPGLDPGRISAEVTFGFGPDPLVLLHSEYGVTAPGEEGEQFRKWVGQQMADRIEGVVRAYEKSVEAVLRETTQA